MAEIQEANVGTSKEEMMKFMESLFEKHNTRICAKLDEQNAIVDDMFKKLNERWKPNTDQLKENKESDLNQVSGFDSGGNNDDDTFTKNSVSLISVEIKNDKVGDVNTSDNQKADSLNTKQVAVDKVSNVVKISDDSNGERITNNSDDSLSANKVVVEKVSRVENIGDIKNVVLESKMCIRDRYISIP